MNHFTHQIRRKEKAKAAANPPDISENLETDEADVAVTRVPEVDDSNLKNKMKRYD